MLGILQALESLGMRVLEIPAHPRTGMDLPPRARGEAAQRKVCVIMPNCHSPLGYVLPDEAKKVTGRDCSAARCGAVIENDVYRDLCFGERRPKPAKAF